MLEADLHITGVRSLSQAYGMDGTGWRSVAVPVLLCAADGESWGFGKERAIGMNKAGLGGVLACSLQFGVAAAVVACSAPLLYTVIPSN